MTFYLDTSFLISALTDESNSQASRDWLKAGGDPTIISDFAALELGASVSRFVRTGRLAEAGARPSGAVRPYAVSERQPRA